MKIWRLLLIDVVICLPALWPFFQPQFFHLHDWTHVARLVEMDQALKDGDFPVSWSKDLGFGYGLPQFNFYAPLFYYLSEVFYALGASALGAIKLTVSLNYWVSFLAMYWVANKIFNRYAGLAAATAFIYIPYRAVDTYVRGAFAELTAITFIALTLAAIVNWAIKGGSNRAAIAASAWAGIWLSHNLTGLISFPFILITLGGILYAKTKNRKSILTEIGLITILSLGLSAFYLLPMMTENKYTMAQTLTQGFSDYHQHFLYLRQLVASGWGYGGSIFGVNDNISFRIGNLQLALTGVMMIGLIWWRKWLSRLQISLIITSFLIVLIAILMSTFKSQFIWDSIPFLKFVQFPWRFLSIIVVYISFLAGSVLIGLKNNGRTSQLLVLTVIVIGLVSLNLSYFKPEKYLTNNQDLYFTDKALIAAKMSPIIPDFISRNSAVNPPLPPQARIEVQPKNKDFILEVDRTSEFLASLPVTIPTTLKINILYFPGWKVYVNGKEVQPQINQSWPTMQLDLSPSPDITYVSGKFTETPTRAWANLISVISIVICGYLILAKINFKQKYA